MIEDNDDDDDDDDLLYTRHTPREKNECESQLLDSTFSSLASFHFLMMILQPDLSRSLVLLL